MKLYLTLALILIGIKATACSCAFSDELNSINDTKKYDFIALVKIVKLSAIDPKTGKHRNGFIRIETKDLFKGKATQWAYDDDIDSYCSLNEKEGEEWLFFAYYYKGKPSVDICTHSARYADNTGLRGWNEADRKADGIARLAKLREIYHRPIISNATNKVFYANGKTEIEQTIKNGKLDGLRKIFYPDGHIFLTEQFKDGRRTGIASRYSKNGQLLDHIVYQSGLIKQRVVYRDTVEIAGMLKDQAKLKVSFSLGGDYPRSGKQVGHILDSLRKSSYWKKPLGYIVTYNANGRSYIKKSYQFDGKIESEKYLDWQKKKSLERSYINGHLLSEENINLSKHQNVFTTYDVNGHRESTTNYADGKVHDFLMPVPAATPPKVYIQ